MNQQLLSQIKDKLVAHYAPSMILLFGSAVDPTRFDPDRSDIDLLMVKKTDLPFRKRYAQARACLREFEVPFDLLIYTPEEIEELKKDHYSIVYNAFLNGIKLYGDGSL